MEANKEIRRAVDTGKISFGYKECKKNILAGNGKLIIICNNIQKFEKENLEYLAQVEGKKIYAFEDNGLVLGSVCGKPFVVSTMLVIDEGKSKVLDLVK